MKKKKKLDIKCQAPLVLKANAKPVTISCKIRVMELIWYVRQV